MKKTYAEFIYHIQRILPRYHVVRKANSAFMRFLNVILFFVPNFMTRFGTTIGSTVYLPDDMMAEESIAILPLLAHEAQHVYDKNRLTNIPYALVYLFPQVLALCSLLSILAIWYSNAWLWSLASLAFLAPIPAPGRAWVEKRGYLMTIACHAWLHGEGVGYASVQAQVEKFSRPCYYWMWPFEKSLKQWFIKNLTLVMENPKAVGPVFESVRTFIQKRRQT